MRILKKLFLSLALAIVSSSVSAQTSWPPEQARRDTMEMRMAVIKGMPDSVLRKNPLVFVDKIDEDEYDFYLLNDYVLNLNVDSRMLGPSGTTVRMDYATVSFVNDRGEQVKSLSTGRGGWRLIKMEELGLPDGIYRIRVDYGKKHTAKGTKPKNIVRLGVRPTPRRDSVAVATATRPAQ